MGNLPNKEVVSDVLKPLYPLLFDSIELARQDAVESGVWGKMVTQRGRANLAWECVMSRLVPRLRELPNVQVFERNETYFFVVDRRVRFRLKKGHKGLMSSSFPTQRALDFHNHQKDLFGQPEIVRVELVYCPNAFWTRLERVSIIARDRQSVLWSDEVSSSRNAIDVLPTAAGSTSMPSAPLVRLKSGGEKRKVGQEG